MEDCFRKSTSDRANHVEFPARTKFEFDPLESAFNGDSDNLKQPVNALHNPKIGSHIHQIPAPAKSLPERLIAALRIKVPPG